jgi:hypothetical protein
MLDSFPSDGSLVTGPSVKYGSGADWERSTLKSSALEGEGFAMSRECGESTGSTGAEPGSSPERLGGSGYGVIGVELSGFADIREGASVKCLAAFTTLRLPVDQFVAFISLPRMKVWSRDSRLSFSP